MRLSPGSAAATVPAVILQVNLANTQDAVGSFKLSNEWLQRSQEGSGRFRAAMPTAPAKLRVWP
jgi:hypothetical protein